MTWVLRISAGELRRHVLSVSLGFVSHTCMLQLHQHGLTASSDTHIQKRELKLDTIGIGTVVSYAPGMACVLQAGQMNLKLFYVDEHTSHRKTKMQNEYSKRQVVLSNVFISTAERSGLTDPVHTA